MNSSSSTTLTSSSSSLLLDSSKSSNSDEAKSRYLIKLMQLSIKCFHHCSSSIRYLCYDLPEKCPTCLIDLKIDDVKFKVPPFIVPPPLLLTNRNFQVLPKFSLLLQPTDGNYSKFLYKNDSNDSDIGNLHIGITNSRSEIFDFDVNGLNRNLRRWLIKPSIAIKLGHKLTLEQNKINLDLLLSFKNSDDDFFRSEKTNAINLYDKWDLLLEECWLNRSNQWKQSKYDENKFNCFDFVIAFLIEFGYFELNEEDSQDKKLKQLLSTTKANETNIRLHRYLKDKMTNDLIESEFVKFLKYLNLLVKLRKRKFLIENINFS
jgi:hypothetical protein